MPHYFAYGTNLDLAGMAKRCPGSRPLGPARLDSHLFFVMRNGFVSVRRDPAAHVWGLLWHLDPADVPALDEYEEVDAGLYDRVPLVVAGPAGLVEAMVYVGREGRSGRPHPGSMEVVIAAARACGLPADYLAHLRGWVTASPGA